MKKFCITGQLLIVLKLYEKRKYGSERPIVIYNAVDTTRKSIKDVF